MSLKHLNKLRKIIQENFREYKIISNEKEILNIKNTQERVKIFCPYCNQIKNVKLRRIFYFNSICGCRTNGVKIQYKRFLDRAKEIHGDKYDYSLITEEWWRENYKNSQKTKIPIICKKHGIFYQNVFDHLQGHGCQKCNQSHGEALVEKILIDLNINYKVQYQVYYKNRKFKFDFFLSKNKLFIEVDGIQHFKKINIKHFESLKKIKERDFLKNKFCFVNNYKLIRIPYFNLNKKDILKIFKKYKLINKDSV